jgi:integrase
LLHKRAVLRVLMSVLYATGLRISEALAMTRKDIAAFAQQEDVVVDCTKTYSTRQLLNTPGLSQIVADALGHADVVAAAAAAEGTAGGLWHPDTDRLCSAYGTPLTFRRAEKYLYPLMYRLEEHMRGKITDPRRLRYNSHSFRVGFVTRVSRFLPIQDVSFIVGHSNVQTTFLYTRAQRDISRFRSQLENAAI